MAKILIFLLLSSCTLASHNPSPELEDYRYKILKMSDGKLGHTLIPLNFIKPEKLKDGDLLGRCTKAGFIKWVDIVETKWYTLTERKKLILLAHEFKHCQCYATHVEEKIGDCPKSLMNSSMISNKCAIDNWSRYEKEIRRGC